MASATRSCTKVVIFSDTYLPGYRGGGPVTTLFRIIESECDLEIRLVTRDQDHDTRKPYETARPRQWIKVGNALVTYLRPGLRDWGWLVRDLQNWAPDLIYLNSLQSPAFTILPLTLRKAGWLPMSKLLLAPRGECGVGAQRRKAFKKKLARPLIRFLLAKPMYWHASSQLESTDILMWWQEKMPPHHRVLVQSDPAPPPARAASKPRPHIIPRIVFASRIDRMKGLDNLLKAAKLSRGKFELHVHGVVRDVTYWKECQAIALTLPSNVQYSFKGSYRSDDASQIVGEADLFVLPTHGENFGHAIAESLAQGCPVAIPDTTLWTSVVRNGGGYVVTDDQSLSDVLDTLCEMDPRSRHELRDTALKAYREWYQAHQSSPSPILDVLD